MNEYEYFKDCIDKDINKLKLETYNTFEIDKMKDFFQLF